MNDLKVEIDYAPNSELSYIDYEKLEFNSLNNVSNINNLSTSSNGTNAFVLGARRFTDNCVMINEYNGVVINSIKETTDKYSFVVNGYNITTLSIQFDKEIKWYASRIILEMLDENNNVLEEIPYYNFGLLFLAIWEKGYNKIRVSFEEYGVTSSYAGKIVVAISEIKSTINKTYTKKQISNFNLGTELSSNTSSVSFGVVGKYGSFSILNIDDELDYYIKQKLLNRGTKITIYFNDELLGSFTSKTWSLGDKNKSYKVELNDYTYFFDETYLPRRRYAEDKNKNAYGFLETLIYENTPFKTIKIADKLKDKLLSITNDWAFRIDNETSLKSILNSWCEMTLTNIVINNNNELEVIEYV